jgi:hypothetical protein
VPLTNPTVTRFSTIPVVVVIVIIIVVVVVVIVIVVVIVVVVGVEPSLFFYIIFCHGATTKEKYYLDIYISRLTPNHSCVKPFHSSRERVKYMGNWICLFCSLGK